MRIQSALFLLVGLPAAMAAAVSPLSLSKAAEEHGEIFKRGATCYNTSKYNNGYKNIPWEDIQGLIDQLNRIGSNQFKLNWKNSGDTWTFQYTWNQAKICISNEYVIAKNTHLKMSEAAWVVGYIVSQCSSQ